MKEHSVVTNSGKLRKGVWRDLDCAGKSASMWSEMQLQDSRMCTIEGISESTALEEK